MLLGRTTWELFSRIWPGRTDDAPDDEHPRLGAWLVLRADDPAAVLQAALDAGLTRVRHPGHPYYFMISSGQVFTIAPTS